MCWSGSQTTFIFYMWICTNNHNYVCVGVVPKPPLCVERGVGFQTTVMCVAVWALGSQCVCFGTNPQLCALWFCARNHHYWCCTCRSQATAMSVVVWLPNKYYVCWLLGFWHANHYSSVLAVVLPSRRLCFMVVVATHTTTI